MENVYLITQTQLQEITRLLCVENRTSNSTNIAKVVNVLGRLIYVNDKTSLAELFNIMETLI